ncbi:MAG: TIR domain-containing protein [Candidatus Omnitrophota bacterium]
MNIKLNKSANVLKEKFNALQSNYDLANLLEIPYAHLTYYLYGIKEERKYTQIQIPKRRSGSRTISIPSDGLKIIQGKLNQIFQAVYVPRFCVFSYIKGGDIVKNARKHSGRKYVFKIDLENFFPSINFWRVRGMFKANPYSKNDEISTALAKLCCLKDELPQGAPTSPIISNMICRKMDSELIGLARENRCDYTRYADDLVFSTSLRNFPVDIAVVKSGEVFPGEELVNVITGNFFKINLNKVRLQTANRRQIVTGLVTNKIVNVKRNYLNQIRAMIHAWDKFGFNEAEKVFQDKFDKYRAVFKALPSFRWVVGGKIEFVGFVRGRESKVYRLLKYQFRKLIARDFPGEREKIMSHEFSAFICHASEDKKAIAKPLEKRLIGKGFDVWFDESQLRVGDSLRAKIDGGLRKSKYGIVILSKSFFEKKWPQAELDALVTLQNTDGRKRILPIWYNIEQADVEAFSPMLAALVGLRTKILHLDEIVEKLADELKN